MDPAVIDVRHYTTLPPMDVARILALAAALVTASPKKLDPRAKRARDGMDEARAELHAVWQTIARSAPEVDKRPYDKTLDNAWAALFERIGAWRGLGGSEHAEVARAEAFHATVFPTGLKFLLMVYAKQWSESQRRLELIDAQQLAAEVDALAGSPAFLAAVRKAHEAYGRVLGITEAKSLPESPALLNEPARALRASIQAYVTRLIGTADEDDEDIAALRKALLPIDALRAEQARPGGAPASPSAEVVSTEPEPEPVG